MGEGVYVQGQLCFCNRTCQRGEGNDYTAVAIAGQHKLRTPSGYCMMARMTSNGGEDNDTWTQVGCVGGTQEGPECGLQIDDGNE
eukprot:6382585-Karenia_brevis.AAC.1